MVFSNKFFQVAEVINASVLSSGGGIFPLGKMRNVIWGFIFCGFLCFVFLLLNSLVGYGGFSDREKASIYECGFEPMCPTRLSFCLRFFLVAVIFLVFDLEVVLLFPFVIGITAGYD